MEPYQRCVDYWDEVFSQEGGEHPQSGKSGNPALDEAIEWVCEGSERVLDFGCGNGVMLMICSLLGTREHFGIDLSGEAIRSAKQKSAKMENGTFSFRQGGVAVLADDADASFDAVILSNILDNLFPEDALLLLCECARLLKPCGKALVKLNPYLTETQIREWGIRAIEGNLLDDGLLLWNNTNEQWREMFLPFFTIYREKDVYFPEHDQTNRLFLLVKN